MTAAVSPPKEDRWLGRPRGAWPLAEAIGLAVTLGMALYTSLAFALYLCGLPYGAAASLASLPTLCVVLLGGRLLWRARGDEPAPGHGAAPRAVTALGPAVVLLQLAYAAFVAMRAPFGSWDAWSFWALKARMFAHGGPPPGYFHDPVLVYTHPDYPLNLPLAEAALLRIPGPAGTLAAALVGVSLFAALALLFYAGLRRLYGSTTAALATAVLALVPALPWQAGGGDADVPLAAYAGGAVLYLLVWWRRRHPLDAALAGLLAGGAAWTKREGLPIAALVLLALIVAEGANRGVSPARRARVVAGAALGAVVIPLPWLLFLVLRHPIGTDFMPLTLPVALDNAGRIPHILWRFALETCVVDNWGVLWVMLAGALIVGARRLSAAGWGLLLLLAGQLGVYAAVYVFSGWASYTLHIQASLDRLYVQAVPLAALALVEIAWGPRPARSGSVAAAVIGAGEVAAR